jgi:ankyrin repeat protein
LPSKFRLRQFEREDTEVTDVISYLWLKCKIETAFLYAAEYGITESIQSLLYYQPEIISAVNRQRSTALHLALSSDFGIAQILISAGADVRARDHKGQTPLHLAALSNSIRDIDSLFAAQVDAMAPDNEGLTPLHYAIKRQHIFTYFLGKTDENDCLDRAITAIQPELVRYVGEGGEGWDEGEFLKASLEGNVYLLKAFLTGGLNPDVKSTALDLALVYAPIGHGNHQKVQVVRALLASNASMFIPSIINGRTPFDTAARWNDDEIFALFVNRILSQSSELLEINAEVSSRLLIKSPLTSSNQSGLCHRLLASVDEFYSQLDKLTNPGFALGYDTLREYPVPVEPSDLPCFTGSAQFGSTLISF